MSDTYTLRLGPLLFRTAGDGGPTEALGNAIETVGAALTSADPTPKSFSLTVPVGWAGRATTADGQRARRQVRALLNNAPARMQGLYFAWDIDPDLNGWLIVGGGDLDPGDGGGVTHGEWKLTLKDCYVAGRRRTHRAAVQVSAMDRRLSTTPRDIRSRLYGTDFAAMTALTRVALPVGVGDPTTYGSIPSILSLSTLDGVAGLADGLEHGQVVSYEQDETDQGKADVAIWDRQGSTDEADWEAVYGPDQQLTAGDIPVLENAVCRVRPVTGALALDAISGGVWSERGRVPIGTLVAAIVVAWTPERAVIQVTTLDSSVRVVTYVTLQRGWTGPAIEVYADAPTLRYVLATAETVTYRQPTSGVDFVASSNPVPGGVGSISTFSGENWVELSRSRLADALAVLAGATRVTRSRDTLTYGGSRGYIELSASGYVGARFALAVTPGTYVADDYATDTSAQYTITGTGLAIRGGFITVSTTATKTLLRNDSAGIDGCAAMKIVIGASVTTWSHRMTLRATDDTRYLAAHIDNTGALVILKRVSGSDTTLATLAGSNATARTTRWMLLRSSGDLLTAEWWQTDPTAGGAPSRSLAWTLSSGDLALFPAGTGKAGMRLVPGGTDWTYDDLLVLPAASDARSLGQQMLMDARAVPALVART